LPSPSSTLYETPGRLLREGLTILLAEQALEGSSKGRTMPMCFKGAGAFCPAPRAKSHGIRRYSESTLGVSAAAGWSLRIVGPGMCPRRAS
jgi:hypothetical protein